MIMLEIIRTWKAIKNIDLIGTKSGFIVPGYTFKVKKASRE